MDDVFGFVARPCHVGLTSLQRRTDRMHAGDEFPIHAQYVVHRFAHAGHDFHVHGNISAVGQLDANVGNRAADRAHGERHHVHGATLHAAVKQGLQRGAHFGGRHPVVGRAGVFLFFTANEGAVFHACHVAGVGAGQKGVRPLGRVELFEGAAVHQLLAQAVVFLVAAVAPDDAVGFGQGSHVGDPGDESRIFDIAGGIEVQALHHG